MGVFNIVQCKCPECDNLIEFQSKADDNCEVYEPGDIIPLIVAHDITQNPITCKCGCFCQPEFVEHKTYSVSIR